ncbi:hypothetical protein HWV62_6053 [Athelia sp. TMB]|nr:hypothetical protein HWV62_6053 [Athelia sp. TMB]
MDQGIASLLVQAFYAWTVHVLIRKKALTAFVIFGTIICFGEYYVSSEFVDWSRYKPLVIVWLATNVATDNTVSLSLWLHLVFELPLAGMYTNALLSILNSGSYRESAVDSSDILLTEDPQFTTVLRSVASIAEGF